MAYEFEMCFIYLKTFKYVNETTNNVNFEKYKNTVNSFNNPILSICQV
jgi:hypothetical protein